MHAYAHGHVHMHMYICACMHLRNYLCHFGLCVQFLHNKHVCERGYKNRVHTMCFFPSNQLFFLALLLGTIKRKAFALTEHWRAKQGLRTLS